MHMHIRRHTGTVCMMCTCTSCTSIFFPRFSSLCGKLCVFLFNLFLVDGYPVATCINLLFN